MSKQSKVLEKSHSWSATTWVPPAPWRLLRSKQVLTPLSSPRTHYRCPSSETIPSHYRSSSRTKMRDAQVSSSDLWTTFSSSRSGCHKMASKLGYQLPASQTLILKQFQVRQIWKRNAWTLVLVSLETSATSPSILFESQPWYTSTISSNISSLSYLTSVLSSTHPYTSLVSYLTSVWVWLSSCKGSGPFCETITVQYISDSSGHLDSFLD